jgi:cathepsin A (carboxypeptidase C)
VPICAMHVQLAFLLTLAALLVSAAGQNFAGANSRIKNVALCNLTEEQYAGYIDISPSENFYFYFVESRGHPCSDPVVVYLNGGPGGSSIASAFGENGPCKVNLSTGALYREPHPWNSHANVLYLDQPFGVGFSHADYNVSDTFVSAEKAALFLYEFFQVFDHLASNDVYMAGASYAGATIPAIADELLNGIGHNGRVPVNLRGISLGNPFLDARTEYTSFYDYSCVSNPYRRLLNESTCTLLNSTIVPTCLSLVDQCYASELQNRTICTASFQFCESFGELIVDVDINQYDIRPGSALPNTELLERFLNLPETKSALGADNSTTYVVQSNVVFSNFVLEYDGLKRIASTIIPNLLDLGIRVLIFNGDADSVCPYSTAERFASSLDWSGKDGFAREPHLPWNMTANEESGAVGSIRSYEALSLVRVFRAGHIAPLDQPAVTFELFNSFLKNEVKALAQTR